MGGGGRGGRHLPGLSWRRRPLWLSSWYVTLIDSALLTSSAIRSRKLPVSRMEVLWEIRNSDATVTLYSAPGCAGGGIGSGEAGDGGGGGGQSGEGGLVGGDGGDNGGHGGDGGEGGKWGVDGGTGKQSMPNASPHEHTPAWQNGEFSHHVGHLLGVQTSQMRLGHLQERNADLSSAASHRGESKVRALCIHACVPPRVVYEMGVCVLACICPYNHCACVRAVQLGRASVHRYMRLPLRVPLSAGGMVAVGELVEQLSQWCVSSSKVISSCRTPSTHWLLWQLGLVGD